MRYFVAVLFVLFFVIVGSILLIGRFRDGDGIIVPDTVKAAEYADVDNSTVIWEQDGPVVANDEHYSVRITVSDEFRTVELIRGYDGKVVKSKTYKNNQNAYRVFLKALDTAEFGEQKPVKTTDMEGVCPKGSRYIYQLKVAGNSHLSSWSTSCNRAYGPFDGQAPLVRDLFKKQIPDYSQITSGISL